MSQVRLDPPGQETFRVRLLDGWRRRAGGMHGATPFLRPLWHRQTSFPLNPKTEIHSQKETKRTKKQEAGLTLAEPFWTPPIQAKYFYPSLPLLPSVNMNSG